MLNLCKYLFFICIATISLSMLGSCTSDKRTDSAAVRKEIENRKIIKVTEAEIVNKVHELGKSIALSTKKTLGRNLQNSLQNGGVESAISFCNLVAMPLVDSLSHIFNTEIKRVSLKARNPNNIPNDLERKILEAYEFLWKDSIPLQTNVQPLVENRYLFTKPILIENAMCITCHGSAENGMLKETEDFIKSKYPDDKATGYHIGDLRGMWSITFSKKMVVQSF